ncbi:MAG: alpha-2-macroglobulin family protein, partial [Pseudomonadota bacterium]
GEEIELTVKVSDAKGEAIKAEVALIVADAALLQLASENVYYPEKLFFAPRSLAVWTSDLRLKLIGRRHYGLKGAPPGGGGAGARGGGFRKEFVSLALFEPHVITDETGQAKVKFKLPDNLTTFKIFAVANNQADMFGTGADQFKVTKPLLLKPGLPNFAGVGDEFSAAVVVHNQTDKAGNAVVTLAGKSFNLLNSENRTVRLEPNSSLEVGFPVRVQPGAEAVFRFTVTMDDEKDAAEYRVPLRFPNPIITTATYGRLSQSARETILVPAEADKARGGLTVNVSPSLAGNLSAPFDYLRDYPYGCLEQKTSMALGDLLFLGWRQRLDRPEKEAELARTRIDKYLAGLSSFQNYAGGFSFWPDTDRPEPYLSAYVLQTLHQAKTAGFTVDDYLFKNSQRYLNEVINRNRWPSWYNDQMKSATRAYITAVLAETGLNPAAQIELLYNQRQELSVFGLTQLLEALSRGRFSREKTQQMEEISKMLFNRAVITSGEVHFEEPEGLRGLMSSRVRTNALALKALLWAAPDNPHLAPLARWLIRSRTREGGHYGSTQNNALVLLALTKYIKTMEDEPPEMNVEAILAGKSLARAGFTSFNSPAMNSQAPMPELVVGQETPLDLKVEGTGAVYYSLHLNYALEKPNLEPYQAGMSLSRTYTRVMPEQAVAPGASFNRGDIIRVEVTILAPSQRHFVVLEDRLPAGFEPINFDLPVAPRNLLRLLDTGNEPHEYYLRYWYEHREIRYNRVAVFAREIREGVYTFSYLARAVTPGTYIAPGPQAEEMYSPEVYGRGSGLKVEIK